MMEKRKLDPKCSKGHQTIHAILKSTGKSRFSDGWAFTHSQQTQMMEQFKEYLTLFPAITLLCYSSMSSHFHLILRIDYTRKVTRSEVKEAYKKVYRHDLHSNCLTIRSLVSDAHNLSKLMQRFLHDTAWQYNRHKKFKRTGHLWSERYFSTLLSGTEGLIRCARYVLLNPVKPNLCHTPQEWHCNSLNGTDSSRVMQNLCNAYNDELDPDGKKLSIEEFTEMLNKILADGCTEIAKERARQRKSGIKDRNIVIWPEESYFWNHAGAVGPYSKLEVFMTKIREFDQTILSWIY